VRGQVQAGGGGVFPPRDLGLAMELGRRDIAIHMRMMIGGEKPGRDNFGGGFGASRFLSLLNSR